jgi:hypothetical protein
VSIHFCRACSFDTDPAASLKATGFVVYAERGYLLTNRVGAILANRKRHMLTQQQHVVGAGPFTGYCIFDNHEEVS